MEKTDQALYKAVSDCLGRLIAECKAKPRKELQDSKLGSEIQKADSKILAEKPGKCEKQRTI